jgi:hypothetical protein
MAVHHPQPPLVSAAFVRTVNTEKPASVDPGIDEFVTDSFAPFVEARH